MKSGKKNLLNMKHFNLSPCPLVWDLLRQAFEWVLTDINTRNNEKEIYIYLENYLKNKNFQKTE